MRFALLIGVSKYDTQSDLPGCINDLNAVEEVLQYSGEFEEVRSFSGQVNSSTLKSEVSKFFKNIKGKTVSELFFYFTGHGMYAEDEFYYILSDFEDSKRRQTSLQNLEIDEMIKSVSPNIVTKVIDACNSGVSYVKSDNHVVEKYYQKTSEGFNKCYFMHSSMTDQYSYQNSSISSFTLSFLEAIAYTTGGAIRHKDIIDYISDSFQSDSGQTPFFVTQANYTEDFLQSHSEITKIVEKYLPAIKPSNSKEQVEENDPKEFSSYLDKIKDDANNFATEEEAQSLIKDLRDSFEKLRLPVPLEELYDLKVFEEYYFNDLPKSIEIARWLSNNKHSYFAKPVYKIVEYQEDSQTKNFLYQPGMSLMDMIAQPKKVTRQKNVLDSFESTTDNLFRGC